MSDNTHDLVKPEFHRMSNSRRRRIFKDRLRGPIRALITDFYQANDISYEPAKVRSAAEEVLDGIVALARSNPQFLVETMRPEVAGKADISEFLLQQLGLSTSAR